MKTKRKKKREFSEAGVQYVLEFLYSGKLDTSYDDFTELCAPGDQHTYHKKMQELTGKRTYAEEVAEAERRFKALPLIQALREDDETI